MRENDRNNSSISSIQLGMSNEAQIYHFHKNYLLCFGFYILHHFHKLRMKIPYLIIGHFPIHLGEIADYTSPAIKNMTHIH